MAHRMNVVFNDPTWHALEQIPKGERSEVIHHALARWFSEQKRRDAVRKMNALSEQLPRQKASEIIDWVRSDRERKS